MPDADRELFALIDAHRRAKAWCQEDDTEQDEILTSAVSAELAIMDRLVEVKPKTVPGAWALMQYLLKELDPGVSADVYADVHYKALRRLFRTLWARQGPPAPCPRPRPGSRRDRPPPCRLGGPGSGHGPRRQARSQTGPRRHGGR